MINCEAQRELLRNYQHPPPAAPPTPGAPLQVVELEAGPAPVAGSPLAAPLPLAPPLKLLALDPNNAPPTAVIETMGEDEEGGRLSRMGSMRSWTILLLLFIVSAALLSGALALCHGRNP